MVFFAAGVSAPRGPHHGCSVAFLPRRDLSARHAGSAFQQRKKSGPSTRAQTRTLSSQSRCRARFRPAVLNATWRLTELPSFLCGNINTQKNRARARLIEAQLRAVAKVDRA